MKLMHFGDLARGTACARCRSPRPARRRRPADRRWRRRAPSRRAGRRRGRGSGRRRARPRSRRRRRWRGGRPARRRRPCARRVASVSPWSARRSEWPTITATGAGVGEHLGRDVAGVGARGLPVAVLAADREAAAGEPGDQRRGRADQHVAAGFRRAASRARRASAAEAAAAVHLPVSGDELAVRHLAVPPAVRRRC